MELAKAIKLAAKIHEESYDIKTAEAAEAEEKLVDFSKFYKISVYDACNQAVNKIGLDERIVQVIYLLLVCAWNDILDWAESFDK